MKGSCYSGDNVALDNIQTVITTSNRSTTLRRSVNEYLIVGRCGGLQLVFLGPNPRPLFLQWFETKGTNFQYINSERGKFREKKKTVEMNIVFHTP